jgi:sulfate adenylyltransferase
MQEPHGGRLVDRVCAEGARQAILDQASEFVTLPVNEDIIKDIKNIATGVFSPLEGFLTQADFEAVVESGRLASDLPWTIPIVLDVDEAFAQGVKPGDEILLTRESEDGTPVAKMHIDEIYIYDSASYVEHVFRTSDPAHPGVAGVLAKKPYLLSGTIDLVADITTPFAKYNLSPKETRVLFKKKGWNTIAAFQTRNPPHLGHEYVQKATLSVVDGLLIQPVIGKKQSGDFKDEVIIASYEALIENYYVRDTVLLSTFETEMYYAGPREAIHHAIARKNFGCTHFIVGRDHAGVGDYYGPYAAHAIFDEYPDLGITPVKFRTFYKCTKCGAVVSDKICPHGPEYQVDFKGRVVRQMLLEGKIPEEEMRPEVAERIIACGDLFVP